MLPVVRDGVRMVRARLAAASSPTLLLQRKVACCDHRFSQPPKAMGWTPPDGI
jgi:hypothetical protein